MSTKSHDLCLCCSGKTYPLCCAPFHTGKNIPDSALELMRSRYCAYALGLADYIIKTTHPGSPSYHEDLMIWKEEIAEFAKQSRFEKLEVLDSQTKDRMASVTFIAHISQKKQDATFTEKSYFEKIKGRWFYRSGRLMEGKAPNLMTIGQMRVLPLSYYGDPILRKKAEPISEITPAILQLVEEMIETMDACDGLGLAAPQVHYCLQLFVIRTPEESASGEIALGDPVVFINPKITSFSEDHWDVSEGCLSIPSIHADVSRPKKIVVEYTNLEGKKIQEECSGWKARVILHEYDHLQGVLFIDRLAKKEREKLEPSLQKLQSRIHDGTEL
jgi:peptide deformylase